MKKNVSKADRIARFILAGILIVLYGTHLVEGTLGIVVLVIAGIMLTTAFMSFCPLYKIINMSPCGGGCCGHCGSEDTEDKKED